MKKILILFLLSVVFLQAEHSIVFVHVGPRLPDYMEDSLSQARLFNKTCPIYLAASQEALQGLSEKARAASPTLVPLETLQKTENHLCFNNFSVMDRSFRGGFWHYTSERFFYLEEVIAHYDLHQVFHLENDNMLYVDLEKILPVFMQYYPGIAATFDNDRRCIPGFVYIADKQIIADLTTLMANQAHAGKNDMEFLAIFKDHVQREGIDHLPIVMENYFDYYEALSPAGHRVRNPRLYSQHGDYFDSIFDAAALGQYLGGIDPKNGASSPGFINESCIFNPSKLHFRWERDLEGRNVPYAYFEGVERRINNLHIHCKNLKLFSSE